ncbi:unnamed protein product [Mucor fragilis]
MSVSATVASIVTSTAASADLSACYSLRSAHYTKNAASDSHVSDLEEEPSFTTTSTDDSFYPDADCTEQVNKQVDIDYCLSALEIQNAAYGPLVTHSMDAETTLDERALL